MGFETPVHGMKRPTMLPSRCFPLMAGFAPLVLLPLVLALAPDAKRTVLVGALGVVGLFSLVVTARYVVLTHAIGRRARRHRWMLCTRCGYPLESSEAQGACPECGQPFNRSELVLCWRKHLRD